MTYFEDCETDWLSMQVVLVQYFFYYTTIRKSSIYSIIVTNVSQKCIISLLLLLVVTIYDFFLLIINVCHARALSLFSTALLLLVAVSGNSATVLLRELDSAAIYWPLARTRARRRFVIRCTSDVATAAAE